MRLKSVKRYVEFNGESIPLIELAERTGIKRKTLEARYAMGYRGEELVAPPVPTGGKRGRGRPRRITKDSEVAREINQLRRDNEYAKHERSMSIRQRKEQRRREMAAEHAKAFNAPLISADLLTEQERAEIRERVKGRQRWYQFSL